MLALMACSKDETKGPQAPATSVTTQTLAAPSAPADPVASVTVTPPRPPSTPEASPEAPKPTKLRVIDPPAEGDVLSIVRAQRVKAIEEKRVFVVYVGADWCPPCKRFHEAIERGELDQKLAKYTIMRFDLDRDGQRLLAAGYGSRFIPFFVLPGPDGKKSQSFEVKILKKEEAMREVMDGLLKWESAAK
jgi:thiol-disulfide isomerase/thioredoxin